MLTVRLYDRDLAAQFVSALLVASGAVPPPTDPAERQGFLALAHDLGDALDELPPLPASTDLEEIRTP